MERKCTICEKISNSPYKYMCRSCYQEKWAKSIGEKKCQECENTFKTSGKSCLACLRKNRIANEANISCSKCGRKGLLIMNKAFQLCNTCHRHKRESEDPIYKKKRTDEQRKFARMRRGTDLSAPIRIRKGSWKNASGYVLIFKDGHPNASSNGSIFQHTYIMSSHLRRPLKKGETIHHINGIRDDNRIENLEIWHRSHPPGQRLDDKIKWAKDFLEEYGFKIYEE